MDLELPLHLWRKNRRDFYAWAGTLAVCLSFGVELGLVFGIGLNIMHLLFMWARPETVLKIDEIDSLQYIRVTPYVGMFFPGIDHLRERIIQASEAAEYAIPVLIDCSKFTGLDYTSAQGIGGLAADLAKQKQILVLQHLDDKLQSFIASEHVLFCSRDSTLQELLTQEAIRNGKINLQQHIRASIDLGYKVDPLISVEACTKE